MIGATHASDEAAPEDFTAVATREQRLRTWQYVVVLVALSIAVLNIVVGQPLVVLGVAVSAAAGIWAIEERKKSTS